MLEIVQAKKKRHSLKIVVLETNLDIKHLSKAPTYQQSVDLLSGIPGLGITRIMTLLTELENISRSPNFDSFCSFMGLITSIGSIEIMTGIEE